MGAITAKYGGLIYIPRLNRLCTRAHDGLCIRLINLPDGEIGELQRRTRLDACAMPRLLIRRHINKNKRHRADEPRRESTVSRNRVPAKPLSAPQPSEIPHVTM